LLTDQSNLWNLQFCFLFPNFNLQVSPGDSCTKVSHNAKILFDLRVKHFVLRPHFEIY
jgi:hypothetical protein